MIQARPHDPWQKPPEILKRYLVDGYCEGRLPLEFVDSVFNAFPELRHA